MKKFVITLIVISLLLCGCANEKAALGGVVVRGDTPTEPPYSEIRIPDDQTVVYITLTGKKYHEAGCPFLKDTAIPVTREQVIMEEREPCSRCH